MLDKQYYKQEKVYYNKKMRLKRRFIPIIITIVMGLTGSIFLTVWLWKVLPGWVFFVLIGIGIISNTFLLWVYSKR